MTSPTTRASNVWPIDGGDDILQITGQGGAVLGGITAGGAGFGALAGGGSGSSITGAGGTVNASDGSLGTVALTLIAGANQVIVIGSDATLQNAIVLNNDALNLATSGQITIQSDTNITVISPVVDMSGVGSLLLPSGLNFPLPTFANNADALAGGLVSGQLYSDSTVGNGTAPRPVYIVYQLF